MYERVRFNTSDGVIIAGDYYTVDYPTGYVIALHMMPALKESWQELAKALNVAGIACLAIDMRGHGESIKKTDGTTLNFNNFSDEEHRQKIVDVQAAVAWIKTKNASEDKIVLVGASVGANLALEELVESENMPAAVLLSPGLDYRQIKTPELIGRVTSSKRVLCVASLEDRYSYDTCRQLAQMSPRVEMMQLDEAGHGTNMFNEVGLTEKIVARVSQYLQKS